MTAPRTIFEKIWDAHEVVRRDDGQSLLYVDRHIIHDGGFHAFGMLRDAGRSVRQVDQTFGTPDHYASTTERTIDEMSDLEAREKVEGLADNAEHFGIHHFGLDDVRMGISHVIGPELGITQPGILL
ncbi:MAG TPA: 3-isopropylmalate dehydratase large subunit, partial [Rhodospirillaceae bacterium]|nr:3-isopropylmalate dehydratase large subunit [Rhodospirillaceae bacterium]